VLFPFDHVEAYLRQAVKNVSRDGHCLKWPSWEGEAELAVEPADYHTPDGYAVSEVVTLSQTCPMLQALNASGLSHLNSLATTAAVVRREGSGPICFVAKVGIFSADKDAAERVYAQLICMTAVTMGWHVAMLSSGRFEDLTAQACGLDFVDDPVRLSDVDYQRALDFCKNHGFVATGDKDGCTVEFPWDAGAKSNMFAKPLVRRLWLEDHPFAPEADVERIAGRTSLLQIRPARHPLYGNGLLSTLEVPMSIDSRSQEAVDSLNRWELATLDAPPLFGAWHVGTRAPCFATFVPNQICFPGLPLNLTIWAMSRTGSLRSWLANRPEAMN
jgi:hypothetical protein